MRILKSFAIVAAVAAMVMVGGPTGSLTGGAGNAEAAGTSCLPGVLQQRLSQIRAKFGPVRVISTYRKGARVAGTGRPSLHASCRAVDFKPPAGKYGAVAGWLKTNHGGGVGTYSCKMNHIHIDAGPKVRFHKCIR